MIFTKGMGDGMSGRWAGILHWGWHYRLIKTNFVSYNLFDGTRCIHNLFGWHSVLYPYNLFGWYSPFDKKLNFVSSELIVPVHSDGKICKQWKVLALPVIPSSGILWGYQ